MGKHGIENNFWLFLLALWLSLISAPKGILALSLSQRVLEVGKFSSLAPGEVFPDSWKPLTFQKIPKHTHYSLVEDGGTTVVKAVSKGSASGLIHETTIDPNQYPILEWRWKVENIVQGGDVTKKEGDDYPARIYITFAYDGNKVSFWEKAQYEALRLIYGQYLPIGAINYIWESKSPVGTIVPNPYTDRTQMIVVESGKEKVGQWVMESRNVVEDYKKAFGEEPPLISGIAIMTDTDNTQESAVAYYGDIVLKSLPSSQ